MSLLVYNIIKKKWMDKIITQLEFKASDNSKEYKAGKI